MMLKALPPFPGAYRAEIVELPPVGGPDYTFPSGAVSGRATMILIQPEDGSPWVGRFVGAPSYRRGLTGLYGTPSPVHLCVLERGTSSLVDVTNPAATQVVPSDGPVRDVQPVIDAGVLLLATPWTDIAFGSGSIAWTSPRLAIEGLRLDDVHDHYLLGVADPDDEPREFALDLRTGALVDAG